jgi:hypothetical protein
MKLRAYGMAGRLERTEGSPQRRSRVSGVQSDVRLTGVQPHNRQTSTPYRPPPCQLPND